VVLLVAAVYLVVGVALGAFASGSTTEAMRATWRRLAWLISAIAFAAHIGYEQFGLGSSPRTTATRVSLAAALGACGLAVAANIHELWFAASYRRSLAIALVAWPLLTAIPAFVVAWVAAAALYHWRRRRSQSS
jgi:uncharacterized membrane protein YoaK (UPF0700 family)